MAVTIFVEGKADKRFLEDFITCYFGIEKLKVISFKNVEGKDTIHLAKNEFIKNTNQEGTNLLIFGADLDFEARLKNKN